MPEIRLPGGRAALVDEADFVRLGHLPWTWDGRYVRRRGDVGTVYLHREILGLARGEAGRGDHFDGDHLNNRRSNLRVVTDQGNGENKSGWRGASSAHRGVSWDKRKGSWRAQVTLRGVNHWLGNFEDEGEAARAASEFRAKHMPDTNERRGAHA